MNLEQFLKEVKGKESDIVNIPSNEALEAVKKNGYALQYVKDQTKDICLEAVKRNGYALRHVKDQTEDICLEAVKRNGDASRFIDKSVFLKNSKNTLLG